MRYDEAFRVDVTLIDGSAVVLRSGGPADRELLRTAFEKLSPDSRFRRFFTAKVRLSEKELDYFTEVDYVDHVAIGAVEETEHGENGIGIARFFRDPDEPGIAEPALVVLDSWQGKGLGTLLLRHLAAAALERGIRCFRSTVLASNDSMKQLLQELNPDVDFKSVGGGVLEVALPASIDLE